MAGADFLGIDLGTTYSCVATIDEFGRPMVLSNTMGNTTTPSVVSFYADGGAIVGEEAKNRSVSSPSETIAFIKRHMTKDESFEKPTSFPCGLDPVEISAMILKKLVKDANERLERQDDPIKDVVITCPAYFDAKAKMRTRQAGEIAGLNVLGIINEPTAAAIAYGIKQDQDQTVLVYDLGGGTFDVTILKINGNNFEVIATGGDPNCGGYDWDKELAARILEIYNEANNTDFVFPSTEKSALAAEPKVQRMRASLLLEAERIKIALSSSRKGGVETRWLFEEDGHSCPPTIITREEFDELTGDRLDYTIDKVNEVIAEAKKKGVSHIDTWILVGGSSYMPQVKNRLDREFQKYNCNARLSDPNQSVAKGAAIFAASRLGERTGKSVFKGQSVTGKALNIIDVCSKTYGVGIINDNVYNIIFANTPLPISIIKGLETSGYSVSNDLLIFESESQEEKIPRSCAELVNQEGKIVFRNPVPAHYAYEICFALDRDGILSISAKAPDGAHVEFSMKITGVKDREGMMKSKRIIEKSCAKV